MNFLYIILFLLITQIRALSPVTSLITTPVAAVVEGFANLSGMSIGTRSPNMYNNWANPLVPGPDVITNEECPICSNQTPFKTNKYRTPMSY